MSDRLTEGTEIRCPLCRDETTIVQRNKKQRPYFLCRKFMAPVNLNSPIQESESFLKKFVLDEDTTSDAEGSDTEGSDSLQQLLDENDEEVGS